MITIQDFVSQNNGQANVGDTPQNIGQCVGLIEKWIDNLGLPHIWGNAVDLMANADPSFYDVVKNTPTDVPQEGDIVCWNGNYGNGAGHTGIFISGDTNTMQIFEQNDPNGSAPHIKQYDYSNVLGRIHPKVATQSDALTVCLQQHDQLVTQCNQKDTQITSLNATIDNLNGITKDKDQQIAGLNTKVISLESQVKDLQTQLDSKTPIAEQLPQCQAELQQAIDDRTALNKQISTLTKTISGLSGTSYKTISTKILVNELIKRALQKVGLQ